MIRMTAVSLVVAVCVALEACAATPLIPYSADTPPLVLAPASLVGVQDQRGRFREIYCAVTRKSTDTHFRTIALARTR